MNREKPFSVSPLYDVGMEQERQHNVYAPLGITRAYIERCAWHQPENVSMKQMIPVFVPGKDVSLADMLMLAGIQSFYDISLTEDVLPLRTEEQHLLWMHDGTRNKGKSVQEVRSQLSPDEEGATLREALAFAIVHKNIHSLLRYQALSIPGSSIQENKSPFLFWWYGVIELRLGKIDLSGSAWGSLTVSNTAPVIR